MPTPLSVLLSDPYQDSKSNNTVTEPQTDLCFGAGVWPVVGPQSSSITVVFSHRTRVWAAMRVWDAHFNRR